MLSSPALADCITIETAADRVRANGGEIIEMRTVPNTRSEMMVYTAFGDVAAVYTVKGCVVEEVIPVFGRLVTDRPKHAALKQ